MKEKYSLLQPTHPLKDGEKQNQPALEGRGIPCIMKGGGEPRDRNALGSFVLRTPSRKKHKTKGDITLHPYERGPRGNRL